MNLIDIAIYGILIAIDNNSIIDIVDKYGSIIDISYPIDNITMINIPDKFSCLIEDEGWH